jgi:hypothetical protein
VLQKSEWSKDLPQSGLRITPRAQGKILFRDKEYKTAPIPLVVIMASRGIETKLSRVSPWFVTCPRGCIEKELSTHESFYIHSFQVLNLPEIDIVTLMINSLR